MVRRRIAAGAGVVVLIVIVLLINALVKGGESSALQEYRRDVNQLGHESRERLAKGFFASIEGATGKQQIDVENKLNSASEEAERVASKAASLNVPGSLAEAQRNLLLALDLRSEAVRKIGDLMRSVDGSKAKSVSGEIAGDMEMFLASDVLWSQRVSPLTDEVLKAAGVSSQTEVSHSLPNLGWLDAETTLERIGGKSTAESSGTLAAGTHGDALISVAVGGKTLEPEPAENLLTGGSSPTFTVSVEDSGENTETDVKVKVSVTSGGKTVSGTRTIDTIEAGKTVEVDIPVTGVETKAAAKVEAKVEKVPGETNLENNKASYLATFE